MRSLKQREEIVENYIYQIKKTFPDVRQYNIFIFGSFLTSDYTEDSDIDIGILSLQPGLAFRLYSFTKEYFDNLGIVNDVVRMRLSYAQYINLAIVLNNTYAATDYCPVELTCYIRKMLEIYGPNPQRKMLDARRREAAGT